MSDPQTSQSAQPELSADMQYVVRRARRTFLLLMGLLLVGFMIIGGTIVYRASQAESGGGQWVAAIALPPGAEVISAVAADGRVSVTYGAAGGQWLRIFDAGTGAVVGEIELVAR